MGEIKDNIDAFIIRDLNAMEQRLVKFTEDICQEAYNNRLADPRAVNYTGNLLNSIVVILYRQAKPVHVTYLSDKIGKPISVKMTSSSKGYRRYFFEQTYDGTKGQYAAWVETNGGYGQEDAKEFVAKYPPRSKAYFECVIAYTTEYASVIEAKRQTTGYLETRAYIIDNAGKVLKES